MRRTVQTILTRTVRTATAWKTFCSAGRCSRPLSRWHRSKDAPLLQARANICLGTRYPASYTAPARRSRPHQECLRPCLDAECRPRKTERPGRRGGRARNTAKIEGEKESEPRAPSTDACANKQPHAAHAPTFSKHRRNWVPQPSFSRGVLQGSTVRPLLFMLLPNGVEEVGGGGGVNRDGGATRENSARSIDAGAAGSARCPEIKRHEA